jgi:biotin operon repressor
MIATYFKNRKKHIDTLYEQGAQIFHAEAGIYLLVMSVF